MKKLSIAVLFILLVACNPIEPVKVVPPAPVTKPEAPTVVEQAPLATETMYSCTYKYDSKYNIVFAASQRVEYHPPTMPELLVYHIVDVRGIKWAINEYDWTNYTCIPTIH